MNIVLARETKQLVARMSVRDMRVLFRVGSRMSLRSSGLRLLPGLLSTAIVLLLSSKTLYFSSPSSRSTADASFMA